ncbi:MAG: agmatinase [Gemmatimonadota bacterium]|nr:MAG: agmatinase [Gemmatimonadota bacterium]
MTANTRKNFLGLPEEYSAEADARFVVLPIPYEQTTTYVKGTRYGPEAIIEASQQVELYDEEFGSEPYTIGISTAQDVDPNASPQGTLEEIYRSVSNILEKGKTPIALGGEHSITVGIVKAFTEKIKDVTVLQLDAHADLRDEYLGSKLNHACTAWRLLEYAPIVQVGVRSLSKEEADSIKERNLAVFFAQEMRKNSSWEKVISQLGKNVYVSIDLDVFDPGIMPSVGTPEPGGLGWYDVLELVQGIARKRDIVGFDVVELCPQPGNIAPDFTAAKLIYKMIGYIVAFGKI